MSRSIIALSGLRGGAGTTSVAAMLADSLCHLGQSVLVIDLNDADLLRLHFNIPYASTAGWSTVTETPMAWMEQTYQVNPLLWVLPYGREAANGSQADNVTPQWLGALPQQLLTLEGLPQWILLDLPVRGLNYKALYEASILHLLVAEPDMAAHILLGQYTGWLNQTRLLINRYNPALTASESVVIDWWQRYRSRLVPVSVHLDAHVNEALGHKMPATTYFPESSAAQSMRSLATWCLAHYS